MSAFFTQDHRRLDALLRAATAQPGRVDVGAFQGFRAGLLRHIGMEEKLLLPAILRVRGGAPLPIARALRLDHGAIASLLVPTPTPVVVERLLAILTPHNVREEMAGGLYEAADALLATDADTLLECLCRFPDPPLAPHRDSPLVERHITETVELARRGWETV